MCKKPIYISLQNGCCASTVTVGRGIETQKGENSIVRTIYTFNGKTVLTCKNNFKEIFRNIIGHGQCSNFAFVFSDSNKLTLFITKVFGYRPGNNSSTFNVSTHEGAGTFQALANKELTSPKANWASGL
ncbi:hypothetical protein H8356DRAFT_1321223 [Neocallimastix lanati (nom. inval.)]|nr:hypothetical protein H8356DRAFT_1321223 [Neocallimastix sp. JGI-2020a]